MLNEHVINGVLFVCVNVLKPQGVFFPVSTNKLNQSALYAFVANLC